MNRSIFLPLLCVIVSIFLSGCMGKHVVKEKMYSGFLADYSDLTPLKLASKRVISQWVKPDFENRDYGSVIVDPVVFYPQVTEQEKAEEATLNAILKQMNQRVNYAVQASDLPLAYQKGEGVLQLQAAITAVDIAKKPFSVREVIPIRLVFAAAELAAGYRDSHVTFYLEYRLRDSVTQEVLVRGVRKGNTLPLKNDQETLTPAHATRLLDAWGLDFEDRFLVFKDVLQK